MNSAQVSEPKRPNISHQVNYTLHIQMDVKQYAMFLSYWTICTNLVQNTSQSQFQWTVTKLHDI